MQELFDKTDQLFDKTDQQFDKTDQLFDKTDQLFEKTDQLFDKTDQLFDKTEPEEEQQLFSTDGDNVHMMFTSEFINGGDSLFNPSGSCAANDSAAAAASVCGGEDDMILSTTDHEDLFRLQPVAQEPHNNFSPAESGGYETISLAEDNGGVQYPGDGSTRTTGIGN
jgi:hypothetical protein